MKIGTQLTAGAIAIGAIVSLNTAIIFLRNEEADARIIAETGELEADIQRAIKLKLAGTPNQKLMNYIDKLYDGLLNGSKELKLEKSTNPTFVKDIQEGQKLWGETRKMIEQFETNSSPELKNRIIENSETLFELTNEALFAKETAFEVRSRNFKITEVIITLISLSIVVAIIAGTRRITSTLDKFTDTIAQSSNEIAFTVERQEQVANEQSDSVNKTTATVDSLGESSRRSAIQAEESAKNASTALSLAESGSETVEQTRVGMESLKERVREIAEQIINLSEQTEQIAGVSELVGDLANQTNMLALNAAVEAARAGEYGKGFGVVAGEIRKLADQSRKSADKINNLVTDVQAAMNSAVMVTDEGKKTAESSIELALGTAESFIGVKDAINSVFANTSEISSTAKQQAVGIQEILAAVNALNLGAMDTAADMGDVRNSTVELKKSADELRAIV